MPIKTIACFVGYKNLLSPRSIGSLASFALFCNMEGSTLLRLFFISIGLPLTCASSSTPSTLTSKSKPVSVLVDATNTAPAVQLKDRGVLVQSVPEESQVSGRDEQTKKFEELINKKRYEEMAKLGEKMSDEELLKCLCQVVTSPDHFKGLYEYMEQRSMIPSFLAQGKMALVRKVIVEADLLATGAYGRCNSIYDAIALSLKENNYEHVAGLFEAAQKDPSGRTSSMCLCMGFLKDTLQKGTACHSSDFFPSTVESSEQSIPLFSKLFALY